MMKRRVLKHAILMATALFLITSGSAYAFCWHMGRQIVCPTGVPDGSNSMYFDSSGDAVFPGAGGTTIPVAVGTLVTYTPSPTWTPAPTPAPASPPTPERPKFKEPAATLADWKLLIPIVGDVLEVQVHRDWHDAARQHDLAVAQWERDRKVEKMAKDQERRDEERRQAREKADATLRADKLQGYGKGYYGNEDRDKKLFGDGKGLSQHDLGKLAVEFSNEDLNAGEGFSLSIQTQGQFVGNANNIAGASPLRAGVQASDVANSSVPNAMP